jgi:glycosyltransferase involved in cell wall biosynthesis
MRILHITTTVGTGGAERMLLNVVSEGQKYGIRHGVVALRRDGMLAEPLSEAGARVWNCGLQAGHASLHAAREIRKALITFAPNIVQGWMYHGNLAACLARTLGGALPPFVWGIHHTVDDINNEKRMTRGLIRLGAYLSRWPRKIVYVSRASHQQHRELGYHDERATIIPNGFDCRRFRPRARAREELRRTLGLSSETIVLGKVAVVRPMKDHANLLKACALLKDRAVPFHLVLIGRRASEDNLDLTRLIEQAGVGDRISLLGERHDMPALIGGLDVLVVSSAWGESFPIVLGEAMASGVPCVTTDLGDSAWIVGDAGIVVPPRDPEALAEGMARLIAADPETRRQLGMRARARIVQNFGLRSAIERYHDLYREIMVQGIAADRVTAT